MLIMRYPTQKIPGLFYDLVLAYMIGRYFHLFQQRIGMHNLQNGVIYYSEVHTSFWNSCIHTIFMPFTMFGFFVSIPAVMRLNYVRTINIRLICMLFYFGLYSRISVLIGIIFMIYYSIPLYFSSLHFYGLQFSSSKKKVLIGLFTSTLALIIQEIIGHYVGGDKASRLEGIFNAMIYAPYYSVSHLFFN